MKINKIILFLVLATWVISGTAIAGHHGKKDDSSVAGEFDSYVFSLSWQPAFCETKPDKEECRTQTSKRYDANNLVLHGLWPNKKRDKAHQYGYCGVPDTTKKMDKPQTWCEMPAPYLAADTRKQLAQYMPGTASCLENHEWYKHGTCSGLQSDNYFVAAYTLVSKVSDTAFGKFISDNVGNTIDSADLLAAFEKNFGKGSRNFVRLICTNAKGSSDKLIEVRMYLKNSLPKEGELRDMLVKPDKSEHSNCYKNIVIETVHRK